MKLSLLAKATAFLAAATFVVSTGVAEAQVDKDNGKCRAAIGKGVTKLVSTASKTIDGCIKNAIKTGVAVDCNDLTVADIKGKNAKAVTKLLESVGGVKTKCDDGLHALSLAEFESCPSPSQTTDDGDATVGIDTFAEVGACQADMAQRLVEQARATILKPNYSGMAAQPDLGKAAAKCANGIAKGSTKLLATIMKERTKCQAGSDKALGPYDYQCAGDDTKGKIAGATTKLSDGIAKSCGSLDVSGLLAVGGCANSVAGLQSCVAAAATTAASGLSATATETVTGVCPGSAIIEINAGATELDTGWTGFGHNAGVVEGFVARVDLDCSASVDCDSCTPSTNCSEGNCRCSNDATTACTMPFVSDPACGGAVCDVMFGPPLPLSAGGSPTCVVNRVTTEITGTADAGSGASDVTVSNEARVHLGESQQEPCPVCSGANIGDAGTCSAGDNVGGACITDAKHPTFGNVSYSCQPDTGKNVSGTGLKINLALTTDSVSLPAAAAARASVGCDAPLGAIPCHCATCSGDSTAGCNSDADCAALGAGTCSTVGVGAPRQPSACLAGCDVDPTTNEGVCSGVYNEADPPSSTGGPHDLFCDGLIRANGEGFITCLNDASCAPHSAGSCTLVQTRPCFGDPIEATGANSQFGALAVSAFCSAATSSGAINSAAGTPGPGRAKIAFNFTGLCADGVTEYEPGGGNCP